MKPAQDIESEPVVPEIPVDFPEAAIHEEPSMPISIEETPVEPPDMAEPGDPEGGPCRDQPMKLETEIVVGLVLALSRH